MSERSRRAAAHVPAPARTTGFVGSNDLTVDFIRLGWYLVCAAVLPEWERRAVHALSAPLDTIAIAFINLDGPNAVG